MRIKTTAGNLIKPVSLKSRHLGELSICFSRYNRFICSRNTKLKFRSQLKDVVESGEIKQFDWPDKIQRAGHQQ